MQFTTLTASAVLSTLIIIVIIIFLIIKLENKNNVTNINRSSVNWSKYKCPSCNALMEHGFAFPPRGVVWAKDKNKVPGSFTTINQSLENTLSFRFSPAMNKAWRCTACKMLVLDYSQMLKIQNT